MPVLNKDEFYQKHPYGCYLGYVTGMQEREARANGTVVYHEFDVDGFLALAVENRAAGRSND